MENRSPVNSCNCGRQFADAKGLASHLINELPAHDKALRSQTGSCAFFCKICRVPDTGRIPHMTHMNSVRHVTKCTALIGASEVQKDSMANPHQARVMPFPTEVPEDDVISNSTEFFSVPSSVCGEEEEDFHPSMREGGINQGLESSNAQTLNNISQSLDTSAALSAATAGQRRPPYEVGKGLMLIVNQMFKRDRRFRKGSERDVENILLTFRALDFDILDVKEDLTYQQVYDAFAEARERLAGGAYKSLVVFYLSHGSEGELCTMDDPLPLEALPEAFSNELCPPMVGRPKVFFVQACAGDECIPLLMRRDVLKRKGEEVQADGAVQTIFSKHPALSDFIICSACLYGEYSYRDRERGSYYIRFLCEMVAKYHDEEDLHSILQEVRGRMEDEVIVYSGAGPRIPTIQVPANFDALKRKYRFPKPVRRSYEE